MILALKILAGIVGGVVILAVAFVAYVIYIVKDMPEDGRQ